MFARDLTDSFLPVQALSDRAPPYDNVMRGLPGRSSEVTFRLAAGCLLLSCRQRVSGHLMVAMFTLA